MTDAPREVLRALALELLVAVACAAHRAMDDGEEMAGFGTHIDENNTSTLTEALDALDELPDVPGDYVMDGWARAAHYAALTPPAPQAATPSSAQGDALDELDLEMAALTAYGRADYEWTQRDKDSRDEPRHRFAMRAAVRAVSEALATRAEQPAPLSDDARAVEAGEAFESWWVSTGRDRSYNEQSGAVGIFAHDAALAAWLAATRPTAAPSGDEDADEAARRYIRDWCPDHVKDYIARQAPSAPLEAGKGGPLGWITPEGLDALQRGHDGAHISPAQYCSARQTVPVYAAPPTPARSGEDDRA
jgi:hypothetical protein